MPPSDYIAIYGSIPFKHSAARLRRAIMSKEVTFRTCSVKKWKSQQSNSMEGKKKKKEERKNAGTSMTNRILAL